MTARTQENKMDGLPVRFVFLLIILIFVTVFAIQNAGNVTVQFLKWRMDFSLALILFVTLLIGALIAVLLSLPSYVRAKRLRKTFEKEIRELNEKLDRKR